MAGKKTDRKKRAYRHPNGLSGIKEPARDTHNFSDVDRQLTKWLRANDPEYKSGCIPTHYIEYAYAS